MPLSYYIYYRVVRPAHAQALVRRMQAELKNKTGVDGRLLRKRGDPATWMEIYEGVVDSGQFEQCLGAMLQAVDFASALETGGTRHMECFEEPCA